MLSISTFTHVFLFACFLACFIVHFLNKKATPLRKAWNVYGAMYVMHFMLLMGLLLTLPAALPSFGSDLERIDGLQTLEEVKREVQRQRDDIEGLKNHVYASTQTLYFALYILTLFGPMLYYNMFKYNLRIEELSGKRMGSFD